MVSLQCFLRLSWNEGGGDVKKDECSRSWIKLMYCSAVGNFASECLVTTHVNSFRFESHVCLVFPRLSSLPLTAAIAKKCLSKDEMLSAVRKISLHILSALAFLRSQNIIHADIKPENILMHKDGDVEKGVTLIDFGNAIHHIHQEVSLYYSDFQLQTLPYRAPEVHLGNPFGVEVDMWSFGCVLLELLTGQLMFAGTDRADSLQKMMTVLGPLPTDMCKRGKFYSELTSVISAVSNSQKLESGALRLMSAFPCIRNYDLASFLSGLLTYHPDKRLTPWEALQHPFMAPVICIPYFLSDTTKDTGVIKKSDYSFKQNISSNMHRLYPSTFDLLRAGTSDRPLMEHSNVALVEPFDLASSDRPLMEHTNVALVEPFYLASSDRPLMEHTNVALVEPFDLASRPGKGLIAQSKCDNRSHIMQDKDAVCILASEMTRASRTEKLAASDCDTRDAVRSIKCELPCWRNTITQELNQPRVSGHETSMLIDRAQKNHMNITFSGHNKKSQYETSMLIDRVQKDHMNSTFSINNKKLQHETSMLIDRVRKCMNHMNSTFSINNKKSQHETSVLIDRVQKDHMNSTFSRHNKKSQHNVLETGQSQKVNFSYNSTSKCKTGLQSSSHGSKSHNEKLTSLASDNHTADESVLVHTANSFKANAQNCQFQGSQFSKTQNHCGRSQSATANAIVKSEGAESATGNASVKSEGAESAIGNASVKSECEKSATENASVKSEGAKIGTENASVKSEDAKSATGNASVKSEGAKIGTENASVKSKDAKSATGNASVKSEGAKIGTENASVKSEDAKSVTASTCMKSDRTAKMDSTNRRNTILRTRACFSESHFATKCVKCKSFLRSKQNGSHISSKVVTQDMCLQIVPLQNYPKSHNISVSKTSVHNSSTRLCSTDQVNSAVEHNSAIRLCNYTDEVNSSNKPSSAVRLSNTTDQVNSATEHSSAVRLCNSTDQVNSEAEHNSTVRLCNNTFQLDSSPLGQDMSDISTALKKHFTMQSCCWQEPTQVFKASSSQKSAHENVCVKNVVDCNTGNQLTNCFQTEKTGGEINQQNYLHHQNSSKIRLSRPGRARNKKCWQPQIRMATIVKPDEKVVAKSDSYCKNKCEVDDQVATSLDWGKDIDACQRCSERDQRKVISSSNKERKKGCSLLNITYECPHKEYWQPQLEIATLVTPDEKPLMAESDSYCKLKCEVDDQVVTSLDQENTVDVCQHRSKGDQRKFISSSKNVRKKGCSLLNTTYVCHHIEEKQFNNSSVVSDSPDELKHGLPSKMHIAEGINDCSQATYAQERKHFNELIHVAQQTHNKTQTRKIVHNLASTSPFIDKACKRSLVYNLKSSSTCAMTDNQTERPVSEPGNCNEFAFVSRKTSDNEDMPGRELVMPSHNVMKCILLPYSESEEVQSKTRRQIIPRNAKSDILYIKNVHHVINNPQSEVSIMKKQSQRTSLRQADSPKECTETSFIHKYPTRTRNSMSRTLETASTQYADISCKDPCPILEPGSSFVTLPSSKAKTYKISKNNRAVSEAVDYRADSSFETASFRMKGSSNRTRKRRLVQELDYFHQTDRNFQQKKSRRERTFLTGSIKTKKNSKTSKLTTDVPIVRSKSQIVQTEALQRDITVNHNIEPTKCKAGMKNVSSNNLNVSGISKSRTAKRGTTFQTKSRMAKRRTVFQASINSVLNRNNKSCLTNKSLSCGIKNLEIAHKKNIGEQPSDASRLFRAKVVKRALSFSTKSSPQITDYGKCATTKKKAPSWTLGFITPSLKTENGFTHCDKHNEYCELLDVPSSGSNKNTNSKFMHVSSLGDLNSSDPNEFKVTPVELQQKLNANNLKRTETACKRRSNRRSQTTKKRNNRLNTAAKFVVSSASSATIRDLVEEKSKYLFRDMNKVSPLTMIVHNIPQNSEENNQKHLQNSEENNQKHLQNSEENNQILLQNSEENNQKHLQNSEENNQKHLQSSEGQVHLRNPCQTIRKTELAGPGEDMLLSKDKHLEISPSCGHQPGEVFETLPMFAKDESQLLSTLKASLSKDESKLLSTLKTSPSKDESKLLPTLKVTFSKDESNLLSTLKATLSKCESKLLSTLKATPSKDKLLVKVPIPNNKKIMTVDKKDSQSVVSEETNTNLGHLCFEKELTENKEFTKNIEADSCLPVNSTLLFPPLTRVADYKPAGHDCSTVNFLQTLQLVPDICNDEEVSADEEVLLLD